MIILEVPELSAQEKERFWSNVFILGSSCWPYIGRIDGGYGKFDCNGRAYLAHRIAFKDHYHVDIANYLICHSCDNPVCCNPNHLYKGSSKDNVTDSVNKGRHSSVTMSPNQRAKKLTDVLVNEIRFKYSLGYTQTQLAKEYDVHYSTISNIIRFAHWRTV